MLVKDIMKAPVWVSADDTLLRAIHRLKADSVGCMPVCDGNQVVGMITDRDILMRCVERGGRLSAMKSKDVMTRGARCCFEGDSVEEAARIMAEHQLRRLAVLDENGQLVGVISSTDLAGGTSSRPQFHVVFYKELLDAYGRPHHVERKRVAVGLGYTKEAAIELAIRQVETEEKIPWNHFADCYEVTEMPVRRPVKVPNVEITPPASADQGPRS